MTESRNRLGDLLVEAGAATRADVEAAAAESRRRGVAMTRVLMDRYGVEEREVYRALGRRYGLGYALSDDLLPGLDPELVGAIPLRFQEFHRIVPIRRDGDAVVVATCDPLARLDDLAHALGAERLDLRLVTPTDYQRLRSALELNQLGPREEAGECPAERVTAPETGHIDAATVALLDAVILDAVATRASDIHFEIYGDRPRIRIRVDGDLRALEHWRLTPEQYVGVVNVAKVRARLDIAERRAPQGGRFTTRVRELVFDVRAQTQPSLHGEHLVLRLLPQERKPLSITDLGFPAPLAAAYRRLLDSPQGMVLVVGPTGSGKTTTLYAGLQILAGDETRKVISVEDPIEYGLEHVQQCQVLPEVGFTFANAMRAFVREDPDVILVGEIRDLETALEAVRASQTGHLVLSTLHCNDTVDAVQRLLDLGLHRNSIGSELVAVISQRLSKRICTGCRTEVAPDPALLAEVFPGGAPPGFRAYRGTGCDRCGGYGTHGRIAVVEYLPVGAPLRLAIAGALPLDRLRAEARRGGLRPLREQALEQVQAGLIALEELRDLLGVDALAGDPIEPARPAPVRREAAARA